MSEPESPYAVAIGRLRSLFEEACRRSGLAEPNTASLATAQRSGRPSVRTVSILGIDEQGPLFFVNARSGKGRQLAANPAAALCFFWPELHRQVLVEGESVGFDHIVRDGERIAVYPMFEYERFRICGDCGQLYWRGSHVQRIERLIAGVRAHGNAGSGA